MTATAVALSPHPQPADPFETVFDQFAPENRPPLRVVTDRDATDAAAAPAAPAAVPSRSTTGLEAVRRRRFLVLVATTLVVLAVCRLAGISPVSLDPSPASVDQSAPQVVVVAPGDTYGAIAARLGVGEPARFADRLRAANGGAELEVGQRLVVDLAALDVAG